MRGGEPGASAAGASVAGVSWTGADGAEDQKYDLKAEGRKSLEKCWKKVKNVKNDEKMSKKRLISVLNEGKNSVKSNNILKLHHKQTISAKSLQIYCITKLNYCM